jgi:hypothetical protein
LVCRHYLQLISHGYLHGSPLFESFLCLTAEGNPMGTFFWWDLLGNSISEDRGNEAYQLLFSLFPAPFEPRSRVCEVNFSSWEYTSRWKIRLFRWGPGCTATANSFDSLWSVKSRLRILMSAHNSILESSPGTESLMFLRFRTYFWNTVSSWQKYYSDTLKMLDFLKVYLGNRSWTKSKVGLLGFELWLESFRRLSGSSRTPLPDFLNKSVSTSILDGA